MAIHSAKKFSPLSLLLSVAMIFLLSSCSETKKNNKNLSPENPIIGAIPKSAKTNNQLGVIEYNLILRPEAFKHLFLLSTSIVQGPPAPRGNFLTNKAVYFEQRGQKVALLEDLHGKLIVPSSTVESKVLIATFPILKTYSDGSVTIDFSEGMKILYNKDVFLSNAKENAQEIKNKYVHKAYLNKSTFHISQAVRVEAKSFEIKYSLSSYVPNTKFKSKNADTTESVGFFPGAVSITPETGKRKELISKYHEQEKIVFHISSNTPKKYIPIIKDGILYWNNAIGRDIIEVEMLPKHISIHEPGFNIVQWLEWEQAGFAYATLQTDPLSGEILQSHIYLTSSFAKSSYKEARASLTKIQTLNLAHFNNKDQRSSANAGLHISGLSSEQKLCVHTYTNQQQSLQVLENQLLQVVEEVENLAEENNLGDKQKNEIYQRFANDTIRETVAHEIGHALGLRHNFAGNHGNTITPTNFKKLAKLYLFTGELPNGQVPTASVMDYTPGMLAAMTGAHIRLRRNTFQYDKAAMSWAHSEKKVTEFSFGTYCSDANASGKYYDCLRFDMFSQAFKEKFEAFNDVKKSLSFRIASYFQFILDEEYKTKNKSISASLQDIKNRRISPEQLAGEIIYHKMSLLKALTANSESIIIRKQYPKQLTSIDSSHYLFDTQEIKNRALDQLGGLSKLVFNDFALEEKTIPNEIDNRSNFKRSAFHSKLINQIDESLQIHIENFYRDVHPELKNLITSRLDMFLSILEKEIYLNLFSSLAQLKFDFNHSIFSDSLKKIIQEVLFLKSEKQIGIVGDRTINDYYFNYKRKSKNNLLDLREQAVKALIVNYFPESPSYLRVTQLNKKDILKKQQDISKEITDIIPMASLPTDVYDWLFYETQRFKYLKK